MLKELIATVALGGSMAFGADVVVLDETEMAKVIAPDAKVETVATGFTFIEGPVWFDTDGGYLLFSDIPKDTLFKWVDGQTTATVFRQPSQRSNGNTKDLKNRLVTCEQTKRRVTVTDPDGTVHTIADAFDGKKFNSPNDVVVTSDGSTWFTDPPYGVPKGEKREIDNQNVYRVDPTGKVNAVVTDMKMPNGLAFSPDEKLLYVAESDGGGPRNVRVYDVSTDGVCTNGRTFCAIDQSRRPGVPDGMRVDTDGRLWSSSGDGVQIFSKDGKPIGAILTPKTTTNLTFGGPDGKTLFMTVTDRLCRIQTHVKGATNR